MPLSFPPLTIPKKLLVHPMARKTLLLTITGVLCKLLGFLYRIFLSRTIGAFGLGIYQMVMPIFSLLLSLCALGISLALQNAISANPQRSKYLLRQSLLLSACLSVICGFLLSRFSVPIAKLLGESSLAFLLQMIGFALLPASLHQCLCGYFYARQKVLFPAIASVVEQVCRMGIVYLLYQIYRKQTDLAGNTFGPENAIWGIVVGESISMLFLLNVLVLIPQKTLPNKTTKICTKKTTPSFLGLVLVLTANQFATHLMLSLENTLIPQKLQAYGYSNTEAFFLYGIIYGVVFSVILFPSVITGSFALLLLPSVSNANATGDTNKIKRLLRIAPALGITLGVLFGIIFFVSAPFLSDKIFHQPMALNYLRILCFLCPFLYLTALLSSLLQGLGKAKTLFKINLFTCAIRVIGIVFFVPKFGMISLFLSMLCGQLFYTIYSFYVLNRSILT